MASTVCSLIQVAETCNPNLCLICQKRKSGIDKLSVVTDIGKEALLKYSRLREELQDAEFASAFIRIKKTLTSTGSRENYKYHRQCYSNFANPNRLERLKNKELHGEETASGDTDASSSVRYLTRSQRDRVDINECIFCQTHREETLRQVMSDPMNDKIRDLANYDHDLHVRVCCMPCLIAFEVKYHSLCLLKAEKAQKKFKEPPSKSALPMIQICKELKVSASLGHVLQLSHVWQRYVELAKMIDVDIPKSFESRLTTFKEKLQNNLQDQFIFFQPLNRDITERQTLLIPNKTSNQLTADMTRGESDHQISIPRHVPDDDFRTLVHAALLLRGELQASPGHSGLHVSQAEAEAIIPKNLHLFLNVLMGGESALDEDEDAALSCEEDDDFETESTQADVPVNNFELSIGQDIIYAVSGGKKLTPKHVGLAMTVHQETRSRKLVNLLYSAGHCMSYKQVLQADKALANVTLKSLDIATGAVIPPNFKTVEIDGDKAPALHITADNIDILTDTLDGKKTFHATQMVGFQRGGQPTGEVLHTVKLVQQSTLQVPDVLNEVIFPRIPNVKPEPCFDRPVEVEWFRTGDFKDIGSSPACIQESRLQDIAFAMSRAHEETKLGWTEFNKTASKSSYDLSAVGYMPLILNPAHELSTLNTVLQRSLAIADKLGKRYVILTTDQALYCRLLELVWGSEEMRSRVVLRMGGLHLAMNFLKVIGKHMAGSGLSEIWLESGLMGEGSINKVLDGKAYGKGMRAHKITFQALWRILAPQVSSFFQEYGVDPAEFKSISEDTSSLKSFLQKEENMRILSTFVQEKSEENANFEYWWTYIDMVLTLLSFTRGIRDGKWHLYRAALSEMHPFIARYDHGNYFRSLAAYISDMNQLPAEVEEEFLAGDFAVLRSKQKFSQVDPDHAQEWIVGISKDTGGLVGITQDVSTVQRWALSFHWRGEITQQTYHMYGRNSSNIGGKQAPGRTKRDNSDEDAVLKVMQSFNLLVDTAAPNSYVCNVATKDRATEAIQASLLEAKKLGADLVTTFVTQRLIPDQSTEKPEESFYAPIPKSNALTLADLFKATDNKDQKKVMAADRDVLRRLIVAYEAGRPIDLCTILKHELLPVPLSLAEMNGCLRSSEKASIIKLVTQGVECHSSISFDRASSQLIIDGQALVNCIGKPANASTFGDLSAIFVRRVEQLSKPYCRADVVFDRYRPNSIKSGTRSRRTKGAAPIRRDITNAAVPLPKDWRNFMALPENKADLARFLSEELVRQNFGPTEVVVAGGFEDEEEVRSTNPESDVSSLSATHEEADTRIILHAVVSHADNIVVMARDSDVCVLLIHHFAKMKCSTAWMMSGTAKDRQYIPIHRICHALPSLQTKNVLAFHAATGCDTTSHLATITKKAAWKSFQSEGCHLLTNLGKAPLSSSSMANAEKFLVQLYKVDKNVSSGDAARHQLFGVAKKPEALPPTSDAFRQHLLRCHYQVNIWENAHRARPEVLDPGCNGWRLDKEKYVPVLMTLEPVPEACTDILACHCKTQCSTKMCSCRKNELLCTKLCHCHRQCLNSS